MNMMTVEQILTISVLSLWFLFPLGMLISFIRQDQESRSPKITETMTAGERHSNSELYASEDFDDEDDIDEIITPAYQLPKTGDNAKDYHNIM